MTNVAPAVSGAQWSIEADGHRATVVEVGGVLREYVAGERPVLDGFGVDEMSPGSAGQILAPWPNRIRDGKYTFGDVSYQLPLTEPARHNAIHGLSNWVRWHLIERSAGSVTVGYDIPPQVGYPWPLELRTTLDGLGRRVALRPGGHQRRWLGRAVRLLGPPVPAAARRGRGRHRAAGPGQGARS